MDLIEAVARWRVCEYGESDYCRDCKNYFYVDPRTMGKREQGWGTTGQRTICSLFDDLEDEIQSRTIAK